MPKSTVERRIDGRISGAPAVVSGGGGGGGGGGGVTDHGALSGLNDDDHPQYLTSARGDALFLTPAEGNAAYVPLARTVTAGDGMGGGGALSANIALAVDSSVVRTTRQVIAGDGMTGGGTLAADRTVTLGTPGDVTATTTSGVTSTSHVHGVVNSSDVHLGESVLLSSNAGKLRLENIEVGVTASAKPVLITNDTPNMERVGILCQPDPQFALDVGGPCRAEVFVGPHAIQLKAALLIAHFDAAGTTQKPPLTGEPNGHRGQTASVVGGPNAQPYFKPGKFGRALQVGYGTSNLILNPSFETPGITGYASHTNGTGPLAATAYDSLYGGYSMRWQRPGDYTSGAYTAFYTMPGNHTASTTYTFSVHVKRLDAADLTQEAGYGMMIADAGASFLAPTAVYPVGDGWYRFVYTKTLNATPGNWVGIQFGSNQLHYTDGWQLEVGAYATPYHDGSLGPLSTWGGTANASQSNRWHSRLTYPRAGNISGASGTLMAWVFTYGLAANQGIAWAGAWADGIGLFLAPDGVIAARIAGGGSSKQAYSATAMAAYGWHHVAMTWDVRANTLTCYLDGVAGTPVTGIINADALGVLGSTLVVGDLATSNYLPINGYIDDLAITGTALTANEIRAVYESNAPVFAESSTWAFRATPKGLVWADENGLWVRDTNGNSVLGVYGGASSGYAWGGRVLDPGDVMIGDFSKDWLIWDNSAGELYIYGDIQARSGTFSGSLTAATGTFAGALSAASGNITGTLAISVGGKVTAGSYVTLDPNGLILSAPATALAAASVQFTNAATQVAQIGATYAAAAGGSLTLSSLQNGSGGSASISLLVGTVAGGARLAVSQSTAGVKTLTFDGATTLGGVLTLPNNTASVPALTGTRTNSGVFFVAGASSAAAQVAVAVDGVLQVEVNKGFTKFGGTVVGSTSASASSSAYVYANGKSATPGFEQTTAGGVILSAPSGQSIDARINSASILNISSTQVQLSAPINNLTCNNDPGTQGTGIVAYTNAWGGAGSGTCTVKSRTSSATNSVGFIKIWREGNAYGIPVVAW